MALTDEEYRLSHYWQRGVGGTSFYNINTQYSQSGAAILNSSTFGGSYVDVTSYGGKGTSANPLLDSDIEAEVSHAIRLAGWTANSTSVFFVFTALDVQSCFDSSQTQCSATDTVGTPVYCAYHSITPTGIIYANMPDLSSHCNPGSSPNGDIYADSVINVTSHEHVEAVTDPDTITGWYDSAGYENGDKCAWIFGGTVMLNGHSYILQKEYSNASSSCVLSYSASGSVISGPAPGSTLSGAAATFSWTAVSGASQYALYAGSSVAAMNYYNSGGTTLTSATATGLPVNGSTVYARLWTQVSGTWLSNDYTYTAYSTAPAVLSNPAPGSTLSGSSVTFSWSAVGGATQYALYAGSSTGAMNYYNSGGTTLTSTTATGLPVNGSTVYVRLWTQVSGTWLSNDYTYVAFTASGAVMSSPTPGSTLTGNSATFSWSAVSGATAYALYAGGSAGALNYYNSGGTGATSVVATGLPVNGSAVHVRLWTQFGSTWQSNDYTYTAYTAVGAVLMNPSPGSTLSGSSATFSWPAVSGATQPPGSLSI